MCRASFVAAAIAALNSGSRLRGGKGKEAGDFGIMEEVREFVLRLFSIYRAVYHLLSFNSI